MLVRNTRKRLTRASKQEGTPEKVHLSAMLISEAVHREYKSSERGRVLEALLARVKDLGKTAGS